MLRRLRLIEIIQRPIYQQLAQHHHLLNRQRHMTPRTFQFKSAKDLLGHCATYGLSINRRHRSSCFVQQKG